MKPNVLKVGYYMYEYGGYWRNFWKIIEIKHESLIIVKHYKNNKIYDYDLDNENVKFMGPVFSYIFENKRGK